MGREIWLQRLRALLARTQGDVGAYTQFRDRYRDMAITLGFEGHIVWDEAMPNGQPRRSLDATKAEELFGFRAGTMLREGLAQTISWYRDRSAVYAEK